MKKANIVSLILTVGLLLMSSAAYAASIGHAYSQVLVPPHSSATASAKCANNVMAIGGGWSSSENLKITRSQRDGGQWVSWSDTWIVSAYNPTAGNLYLNAIANCGIGFNTQVNWWDLGVSDTVPANSTKDVSYTCDSFFNPLAVMFTTNGNGNVSVYGMNIFPDTRSFRVRFVNHGSTAASVVANGLCASGGAATVYSAPIDPNVDLGDGYEQAGARCGSGGLPYGGGFDLSSPWADIRAYYNAYGEPDYPNGWMVISHIYTYGANFNVNVFCSH